MSRPVWGSGRGPAPAFGRAVDSSGLRAPGRRLPRLTLMCADRPRPGLGLGRTRPPAAGRGPRSPAPRSTLMLYPLPPSLWSPWSTCPGAVCTPRAWATLQVAGSAHRPRAVPPWSRPSGPQNGAILLDERRKDTTHHPCDSLSARPAGRFSRRSPRNRALRGHRAGFLGAAATRASVGSEPVTPEDCWSDCGSGVASWARTPTGF